MFVLVADSHGEPLRYLCVKYRKLVAISFTIWLLYDYKISNIFVGAHSARPCDKLGFNGVFKKLVYAR